MHDIILSTACKKLLAAKDWSEDDQTTILNTFCDLLDYSQDKLLEILQTIH